jgi:hypothetical protein
LLKKPPAKKSELLNVRFRPTYELQNPAVMQPDFFVHRAFSKTNVMEPAIARNISHLLSLLARAMQTPEEISLCLTVS